MSCYRIVPSGLCSRCWYQSVGLKLRQDPRVVSMEQFNFRYAEKTDFEQEPSFASIDVSFISLSLILPALHRVLADQGQVVALVKPQFEAGREQIGKNGIIRDAKVHQNVLESVTAMAVEVGFSVLGWTFLPSKVDMEILNF